MSATDTGTPLIDRLRTALRDEPTLILELDTSMLHQHAFVRVSRPGATARSKPVDLMPVILGPEGCKHSDILQMLVDMLRNEGR